MDKSKLELLRALGFDEEIDNLESGKCPFCGSTETTRADFRDEISWREFKISALCQKCQDKSFTEPEE